MAGRYAREKRYRVKITLSCGHIVWARATPMRRTATYVCRQGLGCGYTLSWKSWEDEAGRTGINPEYGEENDKETGCDEV